MPSRLPSASSILCKTLQTERHEDWKERGVDVMSARYHELYSQMLEHVSLERFGGRERLTAFWPSVGSRYDGGLFVIGRAVNGWLDLGDDSGPRVNSLSEVLDRTRAASECDGCPMRWVVDRGGDKDYNTNQSAFWRVIHDVVNQLAQSDLSDWASHTAWSNLYKIAPLGGGNPSESLAKILTATSRELLLQEIAEIQPQHVLLLTGYGWAKDFLSAHEVHWSELDLDKFVQRRGDEGHRRWVVARHPQGKPHAPFVEQVMSAFLEQNGVS